MGTFLEWSAADILRRSTQGIYNINDGCIPFLSLVCDNEHNGALVNAAGHSGAFPALTCQNVRCEKSLLSTLTHLHCSVELRHR